MKNILKKALCLFAVTATLASFTACGNDNASTNKEDEDESVESTRVVYDENDITITLSPSAKEYIIAELHVTNNSDNDVWVEVSDFNDHDTFGSTYTETLVVPSKETLPYDIELSDLLYDKLNDKGTLNQFTVDIFVDGAVVADDISVLFEGDVIEMSEDA